MSNKMRIEGISLPTASKRPDKAKRVALIRPINLIWVVVLGGIWLGIETYGTPHLRFYYTYKEFGHGIDRHRYYMTCEYAGLHSQKVRPVRGHCPLFVFFKNRRSK